MKKMIFVLFTTMLFMSCADELVETSPNFDDSALDEVLPEEVVAEDLPIAVFPNSSVNLTNVKMIEGVGIGDIITIGMTRAQINQIVTNGNCVSANECSFKLSPETAAITVTFGSDNKVKTIEVNQIAVFPQYRWETTRGAIDGMLPAAVAALYPGSTTVSEYPYTRVIAESFGYEYNYFTSCSNIGCGPRATHLIFSADEQQPTVEQGFSGYVVLRNTTSKSITANVSLAITNPNGQTSNHTFTQTIPRRSSVSLYPGDFVDVNGALGQYNYNATLRNNRGRVIGRSSGSFSLIEL